MNKHALSTLLYHGSLEKLKLLAVRLAVPLGHFDLRFIDTAVHALLCLPTSNLITLMSWLCWQAGEFILHTHPLEIEQ